MIKDKLQESLDELLKKSNPLYELEQHLKSRDEIFDNLLKATNPAYELEQHLKAREDLLNLRINHGYEIHAFGNGYSSHSIVRKQRKSELEKQPKNRMTRLIIRICKEKRTTDSHKVWCSLRRKEFDNEKIICSAIGDVIEWETKRGKITKFRKASLSPKLSDIKKRYGFLLP